MPYSYNKLWLRNSANDDIAWCNENNSEWGFCVFFEKTKTCFIKKTDLKKPRRVCFFKLRVFLKPDYRSILFEIFPWSHDLEQVTSLLVWIGVRRTPRVKIPGNEEAENYWHLTT